MQSEEALGEQIRNLVSAHRYRVRIHAIRHMIEEGFDEDHLLEAILSESRILENYPGEMRCLLLGNFAVGRQVAQPLHIVCDYSDSRLVDIVTAYIPQKPRWVTPSKRGRLT